MQVRQIHIPGEGRFRESTEDFGDPAIAYITLEREADPLVDSTQIKSSWSVRSALGWASIVFLMVLPLGLTALV